MAFPHIEALCLGRVGYLGPYTEKRIKKLSLPLEKKYQESLCHGPPIGDRVPCPLKKSAPPRNKKPPFGVKDVILPLL